MGADWDRSGGARRGLRVLIVVTWALAAALVVVETWRSWGVDRPVLTVADDYAGAALLAWAAGGWSFETAVRQAHRPSG
ncbi:MAG TPA: hypothetical protein VK403_05310 [Allosphingosinicella sp.]|nr:hypothetical protein [Allosphingosinicella sp.]